MFSQKDVRVFLKAYNDRGDSLKQAITHILMKEKEIFDYLNEKLFFDKSNLIYEYKENLYYSAYQGKIPW